MACSVMYSWGMFAAKSSFAVLYLRILQGRRLALLNKFIMVFLLCQAIEETLVVMLQCQPVAKAWDASIAGGHCLNLRPMWWCTFVFNLSTDLTLFLQPVPTIWHLQLPMTKRVGVIAMMSLGLLVCVISVIRIIYASRIGYTDVTYTLAESMMWAQVEITALILCSCIPSLRQVLQRIPWLNRLLGLLSPKESRENGNKPYHYYYTSGGSGSAGGAGGAGSGSSGNRKTRDGTQNWTRNASRAADGMSIALGSRADTDGDAVWPPSEDGSTDEIYPAYHLRNHQTVVTPNAAVAGGGEGLVPGPADAIMVTHELEIMHHDGGEEGHSTTKANTPATASSASLADGGPTAMRVTR